MYFLAMALLPPIVSAFNTDRSSLTDCLNEANVPILISSSVRWSQAIQPFNLRFTPVPNVVVTPRNIHDVRFASNFATC